MKKILSILLINLLLVGGLYGASQITITVQISASSPTGAGSVWVDQSSTATSGNTTYINSSSGGFLGWGAHEAYPAYIYAKANNGYKFLGWTEGSGTEYISSLSKYGPLPDADGLGHSENATYNKTFTAHFEEKKLLDITFYHVLEGGSYTAAYQLDGTTGQNKTITTDSKDKVELDNVDIGPITLSATPATGYRFLRWCIVYSDGTEAYNNKATTEITFAKSGTLYCEFISDTYAQFILHGSSTNAYHKLSDAIVAAQNSATKTIVVNKSGTLYNEENETAVISGVYEPSTNTYTIPAGITLLIPGNETHTVSVGSITENDIVHGKSDNNDVYTFKEYSKLTVNDGQDFVVYGNMSVYATIHGNMAAMGLPYSYGHLELGNDSHIEAENGSVVSVLGYITGDYTTSSVTIKSGAKVYELMQIADWRGNEGTQYMTNLPNKIFPFSQYYVQSVETKLVLQTGSLEYIASAVSTEQNLVLTITLFKIPINTPLIAPADGNYTGLFRLGANAQLTKYYKPTEDRIVYEFAKQDKDKSQGTAYLSSVELEINITLGNVELKSQNYVMPINNNVDIIVDGIDLECKYDVSFLPGSKVEIKKDARIWTSEDASLFIYDADEHRVKATSSAGDVGTIIELGKYYNYFYPTTAGLRPIINRPGGVKCSRTTNDLTQKASENNSYIHNQDATWIVDGILEGAIYTTEGGASIKSNGTGKVLFTGLQADKKTYQALQYAKKATIGNTDEVLEESITITPAKLQNANSSYSAGQVEEATYTYYPFAPNEGSDSKGRWLSSVPEGQVSLSVSDEANKIDVRIPEKVENISVVLSPTTSNLQINSIKSVVVNGTHFKLQSSNSYEIKDGNIVITLQYEPLKSNTTINEEMVVTLQCTNATSGVPVEVTADVVELVANEDYTPSFKINGQDNDVTLNFATKVGETTSAQTIIVSPVDGNVTDLDYSEQNWYVTWEPSSFSVESPFVLEGEDYFSGINIKYAPSSITGAPHTQELTIMAKYGDISTPRTVTLVGTPSLADNPLKFAENQSIYPGQEINPLFVSEGNRTPITYTYNGEAENNVVEIVEENGIKKLRVKSDVNIIKEQEITIVATQEKNDVTEYGTSTIKVKVIPSVQWNWSDLYFGHTYDTPLTLKNAGAYSLTLKQGCGGLFTYDAENESIVIGEGDECNAIFTFSQGDYHVDFNATIYQNPRIIPMCVNGVNAARTYRAITTDVTTDNGLSLVTYNEGIGIVFATTESTGAAWTFAIQGAPDKLQFIPSGDKEWSIFESVDGKNWGDPTLRAQKISIPDGETYFSHQLMVTTQFIRIVCSLGDEDGVINDLCVTELADAANSTTEIIYLPIMQDAEGNITASQEILNIQYVSVGKPLTLVMKDQNGNVLNSVTVSGENVIDNKLPATTVDAISRNETVQITNVSHNSEDILYFVVAANDGEEKLRIPVRMYRYPQLLPIRSADWSGENAEKYNFYLVKSRSQYVTFDKTTQEIVFQPSGDSQRFVTFAFKGGPSSIQFETTTELTEENWSDNWTVEVSDGERHLVLDAVPEIVPVNYEETMYYQVRLAIPYTSKTVTLLNKFKVSAEKIKNVVIDGEPDFDVVIGNNTIEHEGEINFTPDNPTQDVVVTAINMEQVKVLSTNSNFEVMHGVTAVTENPITLTSAECPGALGNYEVGNITFNITWNGKNAVEEGVILFTDVDDRPLAMIRLLGAKDYILQQNAIQTGIFTGIPSIITHHPFQDVENKYAYAHTEVNLINTFDVNGNALFDYLIVYGETTTTENDGTIITAPSRTEGSNAKTPYYIYRKAMNDQGVYDRYQFVYDVANANTGLKHALKDAVDADGVQLIPHAQSEGETSYISIEEGQRLRVYITGFCPYASTGYTKDHEGVWHFRAKKNAKLDVYLENCHVYSRNKTFVGHAYTGKEDPDANIFQESYARGSGGVLVFENTQEDSYLESEAFQVNIHTKGNNLLKSNYGCFYEIFGMRAFQVSSPIQIRLTTDKYMMTSRTHLTFDDKWPNDVNDDAKYTRTNGFLSLQKQANNAPSIDMGNGNTIVNFRGGQVELQNAVNVSDKYKTTLAISYRSGIMATGGLEVQMAYGIGTDAATEGVVNFYDGTTTVIPMKVNADERQYYLMDPQLDAEGDTIRDAAGNIQYSDITSCLRCPQKTYVYGGSICMLRACMSPTSQGGAPTDGPEGKLLGRFFYKEEYGYTYNTIDGLAPSENAGQEERLVKLNKFPSDMKLFEGLQDYYSKRYTYGVESVTPNEEGQVILWIPNGYGGVKAEEDRYLTAWKACMTEIGAELGSSIMEIGGTVGGNVTIENIEIVDNLLYCQLDNDIYEVISAHTGSGDNIKYTYKAPIKVPDGFKMDGVELFGDYIRQEPSHVGDISAHLVTNNNDYDINSKIYYITSTVADTWMTFTAPFDVEKIWVVEAFDESELQKIEPTEQEKAEGITKRKKIRIAQATHNADFASFFGVAMALGSKQTFWEIFDDYIDWAVIEDQFEGELSNYTKRGRIELVPYDGSNWRDANFYLNLNKDNWSYDGDNDMFTTKWSIPTTGSDGILLHKDSTYSMLFPYCTGCWDENGLETREYWDYWTGKFLIFESTQANKDNPHVVHGANYVDEVKPAEGEWIFKQADEQADISDLIVTGNSTFTQMNTQRSDVFIYQPYAGYERFNRLEDRETIYPTTAFLLANVPTNANGMPARSIRRTGEIIYDDNGTSGHIPTVGGGNDLFITTIEEGINVAVAAPQHVRVLSSTGAVIYSGMIQTALDIPLPCVGVYVVSGENEVQKVLY